MSSTRSFVDLRDPLLPSAPNHTLDTTAIDCRVEVVQVAKQQGAKFTLYQVECSTHVGDTWTSQRRYSDFETLKATLHKRLPASADQFEMHFPPKSSFLSHHYSSTTAIEDRRAGLQRYLQAVLSHPELRDKPLLSAFIGRPPANPTSSSSSSSSSSPHASDTTKLNNQIQLDDGVRLRLTNPNSFDFEPHADVSNVPWYDVVFSSNECTTIDIPSDRSLMVLLFDIASKVYHGVERKPGRHTYSSAFLPRPLPTTQFPISMSQIPFGQPGSGRVSLYRFDLILSIEVLADVVLYRLRHTTDVPFKTLLVSWLHKQTAQLRMGSLDEFAHACADRALMLEGIRAHQVFNAQLLSTIDIEIFSFHVLNLLWIGSCSQSQAADGMDCTNVSALAVYLDALNPVSQWYIKSGRGGDFLPSRHYVHEDDDRQVTVLHEQRDDIVYLLNFRQLMAGEVPCLADVAWLQALRPRVSGNPFG